MSSTKISLTILQKYCSNLGKKIIIANANTILHSLSMDCDMYFTSNSNYWHLLKAYVCYFLTIFYFSPNDSPSKIMKNAFLFHLKSSFRSRDIQSFAHSSSLLFFAVSHPFRGWFKENRKAYDVINCLNKNLIAHHVWYLEKEIRCDIETFIDRVLNTEHLNEKIMQKMCTKSYP